MEFIVELLFEFFGELVLQIVFEVLAEFGLQSLREPFRRQPNPWLAGLGYTAFGAVAGALSLWLVPHLFIATHQGRLLNLIVTPLATGAAMMALGAWRRRRDQPLIRLDKFSYGYIFALAMGGVRFLFGS